MSAFVAFDPFTLAVPATSANMGPGFDSLGMAVGLYNRFTVSPALCNGVTYAPTSTQDTGSAPTSPEDHLFFTAMQQLQQQHPERVLPPVNVCIEANIPLSRGLGSSSTVVVAGLLAASRLLGLPEDPLALLPLATHIEGHPDNVAPALLGGVQLCHGGQPYRLPWPAHWHVIFVVPPHALSTHTARQVMPSHYPIHDAVTNLSATGLLVHALHTADENAMRLALVDTLHQPFRIPLIPAFSVVAALAQGAGAMGTVISGAGSTMAVFVTDQRLSHVASDLAQWTGSKTEEPCKIMPLPVLT